MNENWQYNALKELLLIKKILSEFSEKSSSWGKHEISVEKQIFKKIFEWFGICGMTSTQSIN